MSAALAGGREVIDAHVHVFPERLFAAIWRWFDRGFWDVKYRPDDPRIDDVYAAAADHGVPLIIHAGDGPASPHYGCDVEALCTPEALDRALGRHPRTTVVVPHLGAMRLEEVAALLDRHPRLHLDTTMALARYFPSTDPGFRHTDQARADAWLERAAVIVRRWPERILYGTDFPNIPYDWDRELANLCALGLPEADLGAVLAGNARRLFGLAAAPAPAAVPVTVTGGNLSNVR